MSISEDMEQAIEATGTDVEAAITAGLDRLGVGRDGVEIEVLDEGSRGLFGLGGREARVRLAVRPQPAPAAPAERLAPPAAEPATVGKIEIPRVSTPGFARNDEGAHLADGGDEAKVAQKVLTQLLGFLDMDDAWVEVRRAEPAPGEQEPPLVLDVHGPGVEVLIGRQGSTLAALQYLTRRLSGREVAGRVHVVVDVDGFKAHREQALRRLAERLAEQALRTGRTVVLEPMPPHERRYIHLALRDHPGVTTQSTGEGDRRKVTIIPQRGSAADRY